jgi:hypothetical protein
MLESKTEEAIMTAYHHYMAKAKESGLACWRDTAEALLVAYDELHEYHKLHDLLFPIKMKR